MSHLTKYTLEFPINSSVNILYKRLSTVSGLSEWFADDIMIKDKIFTFFWDGSDQKAKLLKLKMNQFIYTNKNQGDKMPGNKHQGGKNPAAKKKAKANIDDMI